MNSIEFGKKCRSEYTPPELAERQRDARKSKKKIERNDARNDQK